MHERGTAFAFGRLRWLAVVLVALTLSGCIGEAPGTVVFGLNESDGDVVVASSHHGSALVLPAHTWGKLFDDYAEPDGEVTVYDSSCGVLAKLPLTRALDWLRIGQENEVELLGRGPDPLPPGVHRAPDDPLGGGSGWVERECPLAGRLSIERGSMDR